jgi:hypothetical protein
MPFAKGYIPHNKTKNKVCRVCGVGIVATPRQIRRSEYLCQVHKAAERKKCDTPARRKKLATYAPKWRKKPENRIKILAHKLANAAKTRGEIAVPESCEHCGASGKRLEMHHEDYSKPLDVIFLCKSCHGIADYKLKSRVKKSSSVPGAGSGEGQQFNSPDSSPLSQVLIGQPEPELLALRVVEPPIDTDCEGDADSRALKLTREVMRPVGGQGGQQAHTFFAQSTSSILDALQEEIEAEREGSDLGGYADPADNPYSGVRL